MSMFGGECSHMPFLNAFVPAAIDHDHGTCKGDHAHLASLLSLFRVGES